MKKVFAAFLLKYTFQRQLGITIALGIFLLAFFSSVVGSWQGNERVRGNLLEQGRHITENLARQSALALIYDSSDNAAEAVKATMDFPGVVSVEIRDIKQHVLLKRGETNSAEFPAYEPPTNIEQTILSEQASAEKTTATEKTGGVQAPAVLDAESQNAWRFTAPVYLESTNSPFNETVAPQLLGRVTVVVSKAAMTHITTSIFAANMITSFFFALLFLLLIRFLMNRMTQPLNQLSGNMGRAEAGESQVRAAIAGSKDIADMAHAFNSMMSVLEERAVEIHQLNAELEQRVVERTSQLEAANKELEAFSYSVSHDLRTPLRAIDGFSRILLDEYGGKLDEEGQRLLNVVRGSTSRMGQLIDDMLKFSLTSRLEMSFSEIDMQGLAHSVVEDFQPTVAEGKLQIEIADIPPSTGDRAMMRQVFVNLLSNAIKFSRTRDPAIIKVGGYLDGKEALYFVQDNGVGFDMSYTDKLFGVFQRLHGITEFEGTGIGLAIVKRIVVRHGGRVWAEGKIGVGATIYFALPLNAEESQP